MYLVDAPQHIQSGFPRSMENFKYVGLDRMELRLSVCLVAIEATAGTTSSATAAYLNNIVVS